MLAKIEIYEEPAKTYEIEDEKLMEILRDLGEVEYNLHKVVNVRKAKSLLEKIRNAAQSLQITL